MSKRLYTSAALILILAALGVFTYTFFYTKNPAEKSVTEALAACFPRPNDLSFVDACARTTVSRLLLRMSSRALLAYTVASSSPREVTGNCHAIGHIIGEETFNMSNTLETALSSCSNDCRSACVHGALAAGVLSQLGEVYAGDDIAHADEETIVRIGQSYCKKSSPLCHGIGHVLYIAGKKISDAVVVCDKISSGYAREVCHQGVFMEHSGSREAIRPLLERPADAMAPDGDYSYSCHEIAMPYRHACFEYLPNFQRQMYEKKAITSTSTQLALSVETCKRFPEKERSFCIEGIGRQSRIVFDLSIPDLKIFCNSLTSQIDRASCTLGALQRHVTDLLQPASFCMDTPDDGGRSSLCYHAAFNLIDRFKLTTDIAACKEDATCVEHYREYAFIKEALPDYTLGLWGGK